MYTGCAGREWLKPKFDTGKKKLKKLGSAIIIYILVLVRVVPLRGSPLLEYESAFCVRGRRAQRQEILENI